ncbi:MAG: GIY-YIG nuclease family protein [Candidatus Uhrbacteria bacterium]
MFYVYILLLSNGNLYKGYSGNLNRRVKEHEDGQVESTRSFRPVKLILFESYTTESDARRREQYLKTSEGRIALRRQLADTLRNHGLYEKFKKEDPVKI